MKATRRGPRLNGKFPSSVRICREHLYPALNACGLRKGRYRVGRERERLHWQFDGRVQSTSTRGDCAAAHSTWNENANVCNGKPFSSAEGGSVATLPQQGSVLVNIDKSKQRMTVFVNGLQRYHWPVSTGAPGYSTPSGTYSASSMNEIWYSKQWDNAPMPHAVFFTKEGHAIHGTNEVRHLGKPASHGCVRLSPQNAATLYALVVENGLEHTQVVLVGLTPGGEARLQDRALVR